MKKIEDYQKQMNPCYKDYNAFREKSKDICYIPENAESLEDAFTYSDLRNEVVIWLQTNPDYLKQNNTSIENTLNCMFECLSWEFPSTFLDQLNM